jgi:hypothetical protein
LGALDLDSSLIKDEHNITRAVDILAVTADTLSSADKPTAKVPNKPATTLPFGVSSGEVLTILIDQLIHKV